MSNNQDVDRLSELSDKLELVLDILRIACRKEIQEFRDTILLEPISRSIIDFATGLQYGDIVAKVAKQRDVSEITVKKRISELRNMGVVRSKRVGKEVYLSLSPIME